MFEILVFWFGFLLKHTEQEARSRRFQINSF